MVIIIKPVCFKYLVLSDLALICLFRIKILSLGMTRKILLYLTLVMSMVSPAFSQDDNNRISIGLSLGPSFPLGNFNKEENYHESSSGYARTGLYFQIPVSYEVNEYFRIIPLEFNSIQHVYYGGELASDLFKDNPSASFSVDTDGWHSSAVLAGVSLTLPLKEVDEYEFKTHLDLSLKAGINSLKSFSYDVSTVNFTGPNVIPLSHSSEKDVGFAYAVEMGFRHSLERGEAELPFELLLRVNYFASSHEIEDLRIRYSDGSAIEYDKKQKVETLNASLGFIIYMYW